jgi:predicted ester cyclase
MHDLHQQHKRLIWQLWQRQHETPPHELAALLAEYYAPDVTWHGMQPINSLHGHDALLAGLWQPLYHALPDLRREPYILLAGRFAEKDWVASTGHFTGTFVHDWLGIPATGGRLRIRFGEFCALRDERITEVYCLLDVIDAMEQAGISPLPISLGDPTLFLPPMTGDGLLLDAPAHDAGARSLALVEAMIFGGLSRYDQQGLRSMNMAAYWKPNMHWYGPGGIGAARSLQQFEDYHQRPFLHAFPDRKGGNHKARIAEGDYIASTGFPSIHATHQGEWLGCAPTGQPITMRVMDFWRREADLLAENWVFIDIPDVLAQSGCDVFAAMRARAAQRR